MKYNKTFREALKQVREEPDHEISMARGELQATADKALELVSHLQGKSDEGNPILHKEPNNSISKKYMEIGSKILNQIQKNRKQSPQIIQ